MLTGKIIRWLGVAGPTVSERALRVSSLMQVQSLIYLTLHEGPVNIKLSFALAPSRSVTHLSIKLFLFPK